MENRSHLAQLDETELLDMAVSMANHAKHRVDVMDATYWSQCSKSCQNYGQCRSSDGECIKSDKLEN